MAYCRSCGAYIPDGHTKCLACGLDQEQEEKDFRDFFLHTYATK